MNKQEKNKILNAIFFPSLFVLVISVVHALQYFLNYNWFHYGIYPLRVENLSGIILSVFIHGDFNHLFNNAIPLLILGTSLFYFYKEVALKVIVWIILMGGVWTWISAREAYHTGASGLIYGLFAFLMISGFIRRNTQLISLSFFVVLVYGSMVWGIFPIKLNISFEAHFWGFISGIVLAVYYRKQGPQKVVYEWPEEEGENEENAYWKINQPPKQSKREINYIFKPKEDVEEKS
ncbi:rhomboid family intramembrane serine protease [Vicingus serpentipes]|uniref:rhomboid family intramembrane serine protease n=1 Tax=Vicingus serpentipes TaxID=1926625 RepID=UPI0014776293|nr:rhomboid family intramembrane serine protease [Vicingus serpentipes]